LKRVKKCLRHWVARWPKERGETLTVKQSQLQAIVNKVSHVFSYTPDAKARSKFEHWVDVEELKTIGDMGRGEFRDDCDGFALACRFLCREQGIENRLVFCRTETLEPHLVCESDGYIMDNRSKWVKRRDDVPYEWISISGYEKGDPWRRVKMQGGSDG